MRQYRFETGMEPLISRIPSMFAYLEFNDDWTTTLHPASDSYNGTWGKIVENIALPCGINLCTYFPIDEEPTPYSWNEKNTFPTNTVIEGNFSLDSSDYIRRLEGYSYAEEEYNPHVTIIEFDTLPTEVTYASPMHIKVPVRDRMGHYVYDCNGNLVYTFYFKNTEYSFYEKECILTEGKTYTYRTLIDIYYEYYNNFTPDNKFLIFIEMAIGKIEVDKEGLHLDSDDYPNVPDYVYLGLIKPLIDKYRKYHRICTYYKTNYLNNGERNESLEEKCNAYQSMGGDVFLQYLEKLLKMANDVAAEYYCYAENRANDLQLKYNIPIFQSKNDLGYMSCYLNEFTMGAHIRHGELLTYDGRTYICLLNRFLPGGNNYRYCLCNGELHKLSANRYDKIPFGNVLSTTLPSDIYNGYTYIYFNGNYYKWENDTYQRIDVTEYCTGYWNEDEELNEFDSQHFVLLSEYVSNDSETLSIPEKEILSDSDEWYSDENMYGNHMKIYVTVPHIPQNFTYNNIRKGNDFYIWDKELQMYVPDTTNASSYTVKGKADSALKSLRSYKQFLNENSVVEEPEDYEDWLFYYKIGNYSISKGVVWDEFGNIKRFNDNIPTVGEYVTDLMAYGTILTDIECDTENKDLIFKYVINAHLKAKLLEISSDDDGNQIYKYDAFEYDEDDSHGVVYTETYPYNNSDIDDLVENGDFDAFIHNRIEDIPNYMQKYGYKKFAFPTTNSSSTTVINDYTYDYSYIRSEYTETVENDMDYIYQPLFRKEYFLGYSYEPNVNDGVDIRRGNAASYERHLRLGEYKTMDDITSSGFYTFTE